MTAEPGQAEKSPVAVLTQGGSNSLKGGDGDGDGDAAAVVPVGVADGRINKRQSLSDVFTIVGYLHCGVGPLSIMSIPKMNEYCVALSKERKKKKKGPSSGNADIERHDQ